MQKIGIVASRSRLFWRIITLCILAPHIMAFNPPEDQVGPIKLRIEAPAKVTACNTPVPVRVTVENHESTPIEGMLWLKGVDVFRVEPASDKPVSFSAAAGARTEQVFTVIVGEDSNNALYPLHAYAKFKSGTKEQEAHAIAFVEVCVDRVPDASSTIPWKPFAVAANTILPLLDLPVSRPLIQVGGESVRALPQGFTGEDSATKAYFTAQERIGRPDSRPTLLIHPPWAGGKPGTALMEYPVQLPPGQPIHLRFANALRDSGPGEPLSDGVTFRVRIAPFSPTSNVPPVLGEVVFERNTDTKTWLTNEADLSPFAGKTVLIQLESHPGPKNDTTCDASYWGDPQLITGESSVAPAAKQEPINLGSVNGYHVAIQLGSRGLFDAKVTFSRDGKRLSFNGFGVRALGADLASSNSTATLLGTDVALQSQQNIQVRHKFASWRGNFVLNGVLDTRDGQTLQCQFRLEEAPSPSPWFVSKIDDLTIQSWSVRADSVYTGVGNVIRDPEAFSLPFDGHQLATSFVGYDFKDAFSMVCAVDGVPNNLEVNPEKCLYTLHTPMDQTCTLIPAETAWQAAAIWRDRCGVKAAGGVKTLAGRFAFDWWGGNYAGSAKDLERSFRYGMTDSVVVWHNWQRWGYDYRLPDICPPNPEYGTQADFKKMIDLCKQHNVLFATHDNYIDLYPDADEFSYRNVTFRSPHNPVKAWLNEGRGAQAYRWLPDAYEPFMKRNVQWIRDNLAPTAYFIDVFSSAGPHDAWTSDGRFISRTATRDIWGKTFDSIRDTLNGAPQISESGHDQLIGHLDGAQANHLRIDPNPPADGKWFVWNVRCTDSERIPWIDMVHHDRFALHGAGYEPRYCAGLDHALHGMYSDDYITTEVLDGHPGMAQEPFSRDGVRKYWLIHDLMRSLALQRIKNVEFDKGDIHRQHVQWANGDVVVNRGATDWNADGHVLPQYGFYAHIDGVEAAIERRDGILVEWSKSPDKYYVNARPYIAPGVPVRVQASDVSYEKEGKVKFTLHWHAEKPLDRDYRVFVHFVDEKGGLIFQGYGELPKPTTQWQGDIVIPCVASLPSSCGPGQEFEMRVGLYMPDGPRALLDGDADGERRVRLGKIRAESENRVVWTSFTEKPSPIKMRFNMEEKMVDFGGIVTNGTMQITRDDNGLRVTILPGNRAFTLKLDTHQIPFNVSGIVTAALLSEEGAVLRSVPIQREERFLVLEIEPSAFAYRLTVPE